MGTLLVIVLVICIVYALSSFRRTPQTEVIRVQVERQTQGAQIECLPSLMVGSLILVRMALLGR